MHFPWYLRTSSAAPDHRDPSSTLARERNFVLLSVLATELLTQRDSGQRDLRAPESKEG
jgi:hypothetical protein